MDNKNKNNPIRGERAKLDIIDDFNVTTTNLPHTGDDPIIIKLPHTGEPAEPVNIPFIQIEQGFGSYAKSKKDSQYFKIKQISKEFGVSMEELGDTIKQYAAENNKNSTVEQNITKTIEETTEIVKELTDKINKHTIAREDYNFILGYAIKHVGNETTDVLYKIIEADSTLREYFNECEQIEKDAAEMISQIDNTTETIQHIDKIKPLDVVLAPDNELYVVANIDIDNRKVFFSKPGFFFSITVEELPLFYLINKNKLTVDELKELGFNVSIDTGENSGDCEEQLSKFDRIKWR